MNFNYEQNPILTIFVPLRKVCLSPGKIVNTNFVRVNGIFENVTLCQYHNVVMVQISSNLCTLVLIYLLYYRQTSNTTCQIQNPNPISK